MLHRGIGTIDYFVRRSMPLRPLTQPMNFLAFSCFRQWINKKQCQSKDVDLLLYNWAQCCTGRASKSRCCSNLAHLAIAQGRQKPC